MTVKLKTPSNGSVSLTPQDTASDVVLTVPSTAGSFVTANSSGNVGIGTSSPSYPVQVKSATTSSTTTPVFTHVLNRQNSNTEGLFFGIDGNTDAVIAANNANIRFGKVVTGTFTEYTRLDSNGNLLVGATSNPNNFKFLVSGSISATGSVSFPQSNNDTTAAAANMNIQGDGYLRRSTSALKYKQDIRNLESIDINLFRPVRYRSKCDADDQTKDHIGIIADEVAAAGIEELVNRGADGEVEGFQYERLTVVLLKAIQEQQAIINSLQDRITALENA